MHIKCFASFVIICLYQFKVKAQLHGECITPNNENATCESIYNCKVFIDSIKKNGKSKTKFMQESLCGYFKNVPIVCCGKKSDYIKSPRSKRETEFKLNPEIPDESVCGTSVTDNSKSSNIALRNEFPWSARLQYSKNNVFACEGSLINARYVITAALCLEDKTLTRMGNITKIRLGQHNCETPDKDCKDEHIDVDVEEIIPHKDYGFSGKVNHDDIGLIRLNKDVVFSDAIRPACLPKPSDAPLKVGDYATEIGWFKNSKDKLKTEVPIASLEACTNTYGAHGVNLTKTQLCAGGLAKGTCAGTSGGSLAKIRGEKWYLEGIISFGPAQCGLMGWPTVYSNVRSYLEWIHTNVKK